MAKPSATESSTVDWTSSATSVVELPVQSLGCLGKLWLTEPSDVTTRNSYRMPLELSEEVDTESIIVKFLRIN